MKTGCHVVIRIMTKVLNMNKESNCEILMRDVGICMVTMPKVLAHNQNKHRNCQTNWKNYQTLWTVLSLVMSYGYSAVTPKLKEKPPVDSKLISVTIERRQECHTLKWRHC